MMTQELWQQVERLVEAALEIETDARSGYLDKRRFKSHACLVSLFRESLKFPVRRRWTSLALTALLAWMTLPISAEPETRHLTLLVTSGLSGKLVNDDGETVATLAAKIRQLADQARAHGHQVAIFDAGRTLLPYAESRYDEGHTMAKVLTHAGIQAFAPEAMDFTLGLTRVGELANEVSFPILRPFEGPDPRLEAFASHAVLSPRRAADGTDRRDLNGSESDDDLRLALVSLYDKFFAGSLAKSGIAALVTTPTEQMAGMPSPETALRIAIVHSAAKDSSMLSRKMTWELVEEPLGYDLLIDPDFGHDLILQRQTGAGPVLLIGRKRDRELPWTVAEIEIDLERDGERWRPTDAALEVHDVDPTIEPDRDLEREILALVAEFRDASSRTLSAGAPTTAPEIQRFVLRTLREAADAEVAILNRGALHSVDPALLETGPLTVEAVRRLLPLDQFLVAGDLTGSQLAALARASSRRRGADGTPRKSSLLFEGLAPSVSGDLEINGRKLYPQDRYRVVTNSFLASGGDDYPGLTRIRDPETLRLASGRLGEVREDYVLPRLDNAAATFVDLERRGLWRYGVDRLGISFEGVQTSADDAYRGALDSRASARNSAGLLATVRLRADQAWRSFRWENRLRGRFGLLDTEGEEQNELEDDLRLEISGLFTESRVLGGRLYSSLIVDSEFRRNERGGTTLPRQLELNLAAGLRWQAGVWPLIRFGLVARHQEDFEDANRFGLFAEAELEILGGRRRPGITGRLFADSLNNSAATIRRVDAELAFNFQIAGALSFTPELNFYLYDDSRLPGSALYHRLSHSLAYAWAGKHQRR